MAKDNFIFYRQWWESIRELEPEQQSKVYDALMRFAFEGVEPTDTVARAVTTLMRSTIKRDLEKYERMCERNRANGIKGGAPKGNGNARKQSTENNRKQPKTTHSVELPEPVVESSSEIESPATDVPPEAKTDLEQQFDSFRQRYPGKRRGLKAEFDNFKRKNPKTWREIIPLLNPALDRLLEWNERARAAGQFVPGFKNLTTWLNQQCWTDEFPDITPPMTPQSTLAHKTATIADYNDDDDAFQSKNR